MNELIADTIHDRLYLRCTVSKSVCNHFLGQTMLTNIIRYIYQTQSGIINSVYYAIYSDDAFLLFEGCKFLCSFVNLDTVLCSELFGFVLNLWLGSFWIICLYAMFLPEWLCVFYSLYDLWNSHVSNSHLMIRLFGCMVVYRNVCGRLVSGFISW